MTTSVQFGLRKRQKIDVTPQAFRDDSDEDSDPHLSEEDVNAEVKQLQVLQLDCNQGANIAWSLCNSMLVSSG